MLWLHHIVQRRKRVLLEVTVKAECVLYADAFHNGEACRIGIREFFIAVTSNYIERPIFIFAAYTDDICFARANTPNQTQCCVSAKSLERQRVQLGDDQIRREELGVKLRNRRQYCRCSLMVRISGISQGKIARRIDHHPINSLL